MSAATIGYINPLRLASVRAERIDQGVDYAGTGQYVAIGPGQIVAAGASGGWEGGGYLVERLSAGPLAGQAVYYEEGVRPIVPVGGTVAAGQPVVSLIPGFHAGTELGLAAPTSNPGSNYIGGGYATLAQVAGGGYKEGQLTEAGQVFSDIVAKLGGKAGLVEGRSRTGTVPSSIDTATVALGAATALPGSAQPGATPLDLIPAAADPITAAISAAFSGFFDFIKQGLVKGSLYAVLIAGGIALAGYGLVRSLEPAGRRIATARTAMKAAEVAEV